ncbi:nucleotidyltransferase domain-containing protein [Pararhodospirillum oryzae]|uniref:Polymerase beta nucleotidyltransferase domain-containing protein n=1 Tax=Pararhodospirillum oryzae TaxID=478448 RepID=A0A512H6K6_9PROT|nr:nucleotidyltransferase domain-containing protein [Pararhodospirillum oryzae]GEO81096.1 hypothetical protein ROR02_12270 [Pararhodospirillum oryzae]
MSTSTSLTPRELALIRGVLAATPGVSGALLFGSRAKGTAMPGSDVDLALEGELDALQAEAVASALDDLPLPYRFDVKALNALHFPPLLDHIKRLGIRIYPA